MTERGRCDGHIWLASYPKSGNTWMRLALTSLMEGGAAIDISRPHKLVGTGGGDRGVFDRILDVDSSDLSTDEVYNLQPAMFDLSLDEPTHDRVWKTHTAWHLTPGGDPLYPVARTRAIIYLVRDPRDVAVSFAHHFDCDIDEAITRMGREDYRFSSHTNHLGKQLPQLLSSWSGNVESWLDHARPAPVVLRYEDMLRDFATELTRAAIAAGLPHDPEAIAGAVAATQFDRLQKQEAKGGWFSQRNSLNSQFFRRGVSGGWRDTLTAGQAARIERDHGAVMRRLGYLEP